MEDDEDKYEISTKQQAGPSDFDRAMMVRSTDDSEEPGQKPAWAAQYEAANAAKGKPQPERLQGTAIKWNNGWGFIKVPGQADLYVHQRNILKKGARS